MWDKSRILSVPVFAWVHPKQRLGCGCATQKQQWEARGVREGRKPIYGCIIEVTTMCTWGSVPPGTFWRIYRTPLRNVYPRPTYWPLNTWLNVTHLQAEHICWWVSSYWCQRYARGTRDREWKTIEGKLLEAHSGMLHHHYSWNWMERLEAVNWDLESVILSPVGNSEAHVGRKWGPFF